MGLLCSLELGVVGGGGNYLHHLLAGHAPVTPPSLESVRKTVD